MHFHQIEFIVIRTSAHFINFTDEVLFNVQIKNNRCC